MIVVFGGAGFIGSHVAAWFSSRGVRVRVVDDRSRSRLLGVEGGSLDSWEYVAGLANVEAYDLSILDHSSLADLVEGATGVVHAAGQTAVTASVDDPRTDFMVNAVGTVNVLEAVRTAAADASLVFCSTNKVYGDNVNALPIRRVGQRYVFDEAWAAGVPETLSIDYCKHSPYGASKTAADLYVQEYGRMYGLRTTVFRMSCIYGPRQWGVTDQGWLAWFGRALLSDAPITIYGDGKQTRDLLHVVDLVSAIDAALASDSHGEVFNVGGGPSFSSSLLEAIDVLEGLTGRSAQIRFGDWRPSDQRIYVSDIRKASSLLGWQPTISPKDGLADLVAWLTTTDEVTVG
jgi:CDP-paratose 2-epimerase